MGPRICEVCKTLEKIGPSNVSRMHDVLPHISKSLMSEFLQKAAAQGLVRAALKPGLKWGNVYTVVPGWRTVGVKKPEPRNNPISSFVEEVCEILSEFRYGAGCIDINSKHPEWESQKISKACCLAVKHKLMTVSRRQGRNSIYKVTPGWQAIIRSKEKKAYARPVPGPTRWTGVSSVFQMGAM